MAASKKRILILGSGFGGAYAAQKLSKSLRNDNFELTLVDRNNYLLFYPLLVEACVGALEPRHVVVPIRRFLSGGEFLMGEITSVDLVAKKVEVKLPGFSASKVIEYDQLILSLGSVTKIPDVPGLREHGFQLKSLADAISLRDRGIRLLEMANTLSSPAERKALLTVIVVGGNYTGVEFAGEYQAFLIKACRKYKNVSPSDIDVRILELADRILGTVDKELSDWAANTLRRRGLKIQTGNTATEIGPDFVVLKSEERLATRTVVWAAGIAPNPLIEKISGLSRNQRGYIECERDLRVKGFQDVWAIGDSATSYDADGKPYPATAQTASRQGPRVAANILATANGRPTKPFDYKDLGSFAIIGHRQAAAEVLGMRFRGFLGWFLYRGNYLVKMPTFSMKARLAMDWLLELLLPSEIVQLGVHGEK